MRNWQAEINRCDDPNELRDLLEEIELVVEQSLQSPYESVAALRTTRDLELLLRYGEYKLEKLLA